MGSHGIRNLQECVPTYNINVLGVHISLTDETLTHSNVSTVLNTVKVDQLRWCSIYQTECGSALVMSSSDVMSVSTTEYTYHHTRHGPTSLVNSTTRRRRQLWKLQRDISREHQVCVGVACVCTGMLEDAYDHVYMTCQLIHACSDVHCVCSSAFVDYTDAHTDHICAHVHHPTQSQPSLWKH